MHSRVYAAAQAQKSLQGRLMDGLIHKAFSGSGRDLVMAALGRERVSDEERAEMVLGKQIECEAKIADGMTQAAIADAVQHGLATPAPTRQ